MKSKILFNDPKGKHRIGVKVGDSIKIFSGRKFKISNCSNVREVAVKKSK